jgi:hypothetical protein
MLPECPECARLWREYAAATTAHIKLESKLQVAALEHDVENIKRLTVQVEGARKVRQDSRERLRSHEESHAKAATEDATTV